MINSVVQSIAYYLKDSSSSTFPLSLIPRIKIVKLLGLLGHFALRISVDPHIHKEVQKCWKTDFSPQHSLNISLERRHSMYVVLAIYHKQSNRKTQKRHGEGGRCLGSGSDAQMTGILSANTFNGSRIDKRIYFLDHQVCQDASYFLRLVVFALFLQTTLSYSLHEP